MKPVIVVPRRRHWWRDRLWAYCRRTWEWSPWPLLEVYHEDGLFNRSWCANEGARLAGDWDVLLLVDADVIVPETQARSAVDRALLTRRYTVAGTRRYGLTMRSTQRIVGGYPLERFMELRLEPCEIGEHRPECKVNRHNFNSHAVAIRRDLWETVGGFDERFQGWGHEDGAFLAACQTFQPVVERVDGDVIHLWHERAPERSRIHPHWGKNKALRARYIEATGNQEAMRALLDERMVSV